MDSDSDPVISGDEWERLELLNLERAVLKNYVSGHPLDTDADTWRRYVGSGRGLGEIGEQLEGEVVRVVGAIVGKQIRKTRKGDNIYICTLEDLTGSRNVTMFSDTVEGREELLEVGQVVCTEAKVEEDLFGGKRDDTAGEAEADGDAPERAMKLTAMRLYQWQPERVPASDESDQIDGAEDTGAGEDLHPVRSDAPGRAAVAETTNPDPPATAQEANRSQAPSAEAATAPISSGDLLIEITTEQFEPAWINRLREICLAHPGDQSIRLKLGEKRLRLVSQNDRQPVLVQAGPEFKAAVRSLLVVTPASGPA
jgi:DNA polymerase-3 subunit alpha